MAPNVKGNRSCKPLPNPVRPLSVAERRLLWSIRKHFSTDKVTPGLKRFAAIGKMPEGTVRVYVPRLAASGHIELSNTKPPKVLGLTRKGHDAVRPYESRIEEIVKGA